MVALFGDFSLFTPLATILKASMSNPESVSSKIANLGVSIAIWKISFLFFSPPENPSFTERLANLASNSTKADFSLTIAKNSFAETGSIPLYALVSLMAVFKKLMLLTPGISIGY